MGPSDTAGSQPDKGTSSFFISEPVRRLISILFSPHHSTRTVRDTKIQTNLIVTPATLWQQWVDEIVTHAPGLKVLQYSGYNKIKLPKAPEPDEDTAGGLSNSHRAWYHELHKQCRHDHSDTNCPGAPTFMTLT